MRVSERVESFTVEVRDQRSPIRTSVETGKKGQSIKMIL